MTILYTKRLKTTLKKSVKFENIWVVVTSNTTTTTIKQFVEGSKLTDLDCDLIIFCKKKISEKLKKVPN